METFDKHFQVFRPTSKDFFSILIISLCGETQVKSSLDAVCHDFRCCSSVKWWVIKRHSGQDRETSSRAELLCCMQQTTSVGFQKKLPHAVSTQTPDFDLEKSSLDWDSLVTECQLVSLENQTLNFLKKKKVVNFHFLKKALKTENFQSNSRKRNFNREHFRFRPQKQPWCLTAL